MGRRNLFSVKMVKGRQSILPTSFPKGTSKKNESRSPEAYRRFVSLTECPNQKSWQNNQIPTCSTSPVRSAPGWRLPMWTVPHTQLPAWLTHAVILSGVNEGCLWTPWNKQEYQVLSRDPLPKGGGGSCGYHSYFIVSLRKHKNKINNINVALFYFAYSSIWLLFLWSSPITSHLHLP